MLMQLKICFYLDFFVFLILDFEKKLQLQKLKSNSFKTLIVDRLLVLVTDWIVKYIRFLNEQN